MNRESTNKIYIYINIFVVSLNCVENLVTKGKLSDPLGRIGFEGWTAWIQQQIFAFIWA